MEDKYIHKLIDWAVFDDARKQLYHDALPKMTVDERYELVMFLWDMVLDKLNEKVMSRMEDMVSEMATEDSSVEYEKKDFKAVEDEIVNEFLSTQLGIEDDDELSRLKDELNNIGKKVEEHDQVLSKFKNKFPEEL